MRILLIGASGQLGFEVALRSCAAGFALTAPQPRDLDITQGAQVFGLCRSCRPDVVINCAAYTAVDKAEEEKELAYQVNQGGVRCLALAAKDANCRLIHISTDYVFDGAAKSPIDENSPVNPLGVYGASKLAGEREVLQVLGERGLVVRTSSLHGQNGINFVHTMLRLFASRGLVRVVDDQYMSPTWAGWLAEILLQLAGQRRSGIVHACCSGVISWYDFADAILGLVRARVRKDARVERIKCAQYVRPAKRPAYSALECSKLSGWIGRAPIPWQDGLKLHLRDIGWV